MDTRKLQPEPDTDLISRQSTLKIPYGKLGGFAAAVLACVMLFQLIIPSKGDVEQLKANLTALQLVVGNNEAKSANDHDTLIKVSTDLDVIRHWVEKQKQ